MFGKKKEPEEEDANEEEESTEEKKPENVDTGNPKLDMQLIRMGAQIEGFGEIRKSNSERFSRISEQIGELRGMIMDVNKSIGTIEVKATRASDLVSSVQPEKLMIDVRKTEGKVEGLKANIDSNETIMKDIMKSLKDMRQQMNFYKGIDQVIKLNEEVKKEIMEIKKIEASTKRNADRINTIFIEFNKKFSDFEKYDNSVKDLTRSVRKIEADFDKIKVNTELKADKKETAKILDKFNEFEKHTTNMLNLLDNRNKQAKDAIIGDYKNIQKKIAEKYDVNLERKEQAKEEKPEEKKSIGGLFGFLKKKGDEKPEEKKESSSENSSSEEPKPESAEPQEDQKVSNG